MQALVGQVFGETLAKVPCSVCPEKMPDTLFNQLGAQMFQMLKVGT
jgi:hypothetical protein